MLKEKNKHMLILVSIILLTCLIMFKDYIFGNKLFVFIDIGGDTREQYVMYYYNVVNKLIEGNFSLWNFNNGMGASIFAGGIYIFDPFNWILYLLGLIFGVSKIPSLIIYIYILKIILSGIACYSFVDFFKGSSKSNIVASIIYAFNGYMMVWGQHYQFQTILILFPILLLCCEKFLENNRNGLFLAIVSGIIACYSVYFSYMSFIVLGIYSICRLMYLNGDLKYVILKLKDILLWVILGIMLSFIIFLPSVYLILEVSGRTNIEGSIISRIIETLLSLYDYGYYKSLILRFFSSNLEGINSDYVGYINYYENINIYFSLIFTIIFPQFIFQLFQNNKNKKNLIIKIAILLGFLGLVMPLMTLALNGFTKPFSRHSFLYMPFFALITVITLDNIIIYKKIYNKAIIISLLLFLSSIIISIINMNEINKYFIYNILIMGVCYVAMNFYLKNISINYSRFKYIILIAMILINIITEGYITSSCRATITKEDHNYGNDKYISDITDALEYIDNNDSSFYRVEKDFISNSYYMDSMSQNYRSISSYNSTLNLNIKNFINKLYPSLAGTYEIQTNFRKPEVIEDNFLATILNVKYLISKDENLMIPGYVYFKKFGSVSVYLNDNIKSPAIFYEKFILEEDYEELNDNINKEDILSKAIILNKNSKNAKDLLYKNEPYIEDVLDYRNIYYNTSVGLKLNNLPEKLESKKNGIDPNFTININPKYYKNIDNGIEMKFEVFVSNDEKLQIFNIGNDYTPTEKNSKTYNVYSDEANIINYKIPRGTKQLRIDYDSENIKIQNIRFKDNLAKVIPKESLFFMDKMESDDRITGYIDAKKDGVLYMSIPFEKGWKVYVDGVENELLRANFGFVAVDIKSGYHNIAFEYNEPLIKIGKYFSIGSIIILLIVIGRNKLYAKEK